MASASVEQEFDLPAEALWALVGDFGDVGKWSGEPAEHVQEGEGVGSLRRLTVDDGAVIVDRLEAQTENSYTYSVVDPESSPCRSVLHRHDDGAADRCRAQSSDLGGRVRADGISEEKATSFALSMYGLGIGLMRQTVAAMPGNERPHRPVVQAGGRSKDER